MQKIAKGQITLVSLSDGSSSMFFISPNISTQQIYDTSASTYVPNYTTTPLILTPKLSVGGVPITNATYTWKWNDAVVGNGDTYRLDENLTTEQKVITCVADYTDPNSNNACTTEAYCVISRITTGGTDVNVLLDPIGLNYVDQDNDTITLKAVAYYGSSNKSNTNATDGIKYNWSIYNFSYNDFRGFKGSASESTGCIDPNAANSYNTTIYLKKKENLEEGNYYWFTNGTAENYDIKINNDTMEIKADAIDVKETIKCEGTVYTVSDNKVSATLGADSDIETVRDLTDQYTAGITASAMALTSSVQASKLTATLYQNGIDVTAKMNPKYDWDAYVVSSTSGESTTVWPEYKRSGNAADGYVYTAMTPGEIEEGTGYWITGDASNPNTAEFTGNREVTVYRTQVGNASNIACKISW